MTWRSENGRIIILGTIAGIKPQVVNEFMECERGGNMVASIKLENGEAKQVKQIASFFKKEYKIKYNKKLTRKVRLYISEKNTMKSMNDILSLYEHNLN